MDSQGKPDIDGLLVEHLPRLRAFVRLRTNKVIRARESHSDLVQSVCREVLQDVGDFEFRGESAFRNWLYTAALRKIVQRARHWDAQKRDARREVTPDADRNAAGLAAAYATVSTPSRLLGERENLELLESAFDDLSEEHREIVTMAKLIGLPYSEIASQLGRSQESCRQLLRRALIKLRMAVERRGVRQDP